MEAIIAIAAVLLTSIQLIPQTIEAIKDKDLSHLSTSTYIMICISTFLWLLHGSNIGDAALMFANIIMFSCAATILYMKMKKKSSASNHATKRVTAVRRRR